jgi:hypothetical protein
MELQRTCRCPVKAIPAACRRFDLGFQGTPAPKSIFARNHELRAGKLGVGIDLAELLELLFRGFSQPIRIRPRWERLRHGTPSFVAPMSACAG